MGTEISPNFILRCDNRTSLQINSTTSSYFEGCDLAALDSMAVLTLSACWREGRMTMEHRDGKVDVTLICSLKVCLCAIALARRPSA